MLTKEETELNSSRIFLFPKNINNIKILNSDMESFVVIFFFISPFFLFM